MKIPDRLKIGGHWYKVIYPYAYRERSDLCGQHMESLREIRLAGVDSMGNELPESEIALNFLHEVLHACDNLTGQEMFSEEGVGENRVEGLS